jgi:membrane-associated progesterone receptor component
MLEILFSASPTTFAVAIVVVLIVTAFAFGNRRPAPPLVIRAEHRDYTEAELKSYDGVNPNQPILMAIKGKVYDVTRGRDFYGAGGSYSKLSGRDASRALAKMQTDEQATHLDDLTEAEKDALNDWIHFFEDKYFFVGKLLK